MAVSISQLPSELPECCLRLLGRRGWFDRQLLASIRIRPATRFVRAISSRFITRVDISATTLGDTIYFRRAEGFDLQSPAGLALLAHEIRHVEQYREYGGILRFARFYIIEYFQGGYGPNISFEANAIEVGHIVRTHFESEFAHNGGILPCEGADKNFVSNPLYHFLDPVPLSMI